MTTGLVQWKGVHQDQRIRHHPLLLDTRQIESPTETPDLGLLLPTHEKSSSKVVRFPLPSVNVNYINNYTNPKSDSKKPVIENLSKNSLRIK